MEKHISGGARERLKIGDRVEATERAFANGLWRRKQAPVYGAVVGFARSPLGVTVVVEGRKSKGRYHIDFWRPASVPDPRTPSEHG